MKKKELESSQKYPETLEEQRDYYLKLYEKWAKWQTKSPEKLPEGFRTKAEFDFEKEIKIYKDKIDESRVKYNIFAWSYPYVNQTNFYKLCDFDTEIKEINIFIIGKSVILMNFNFSKKVLIIGNEIRNVVNFIKVNGDVKIKTLMLNSINLVFENCNFSHITLENFDLRHFSVETMEYLQEMKKENKLTLINCKEWEFPILRENLEMEEIGKKVWEKKIILDEKNKPLRTLLHKHLAFFSDFVELTEGKKVQIRITSETQIILVEIFSFNGATSELIERKYYEFIDYSLNDEKDTSKINFSEKIDIITRIKNEGTIGFAKGMFIGEKNHLEDLQKDKFEWQQLAKDLIKKLPDYKPNQQISITNSMSNYNLHNSANNNSGNLNLGENNQIIDNKITEILANNPDLELRKVLFEIKELKNQIIQNPQIEESDKEDSLEAVNEIVHNLEKKDKPENQKIIRNAFKKLSPIAGNLSLGIITNLAWEMLKFYFGLKF